MRSIYAVMTRRTQSDRSSRSTTPSPSATNADSTSRSACVVMPAATSEPDGDRISCARVGPCGTHEESPDPHGGDRRLPGVEPVLVVNGPHRELADRPEAERLQVAERIARIRDLRV